jgi:MYXO-CTERM domain-containing protein
MRATTTLTLTLMALLASATAEAKISVTPSDLKAIVDTNAKGEKMPYRLWRPDGYDDPKNASRSYPLVLFLHGQGERGTDNLLQVKKHNGSFELLSDANRQTNPTFFIAPQCAKSGAYGWNADRRKHLREILTKLQAQYRIDPRRLYLTGISMGGNGAWTMAIDYPALWAAAVPMSGWGPNNKAAVLKDMPIWAFHAADDSVVKVSGTDNMIDAINKAGGSPKYTRYASGGHAIWSKSYADPQLAPWLFGQQLPAAPLPDAGLGGDGSAPDGGQASDASPADASPAGDASPVNDSAVDDSAVTADAHGDGTSPLGDTGTARDVATADAAQGNGDDDGCAIHHGPFGASSLPAALIALFGLAWLRRRRRR